MMDVGPANKESAKMRHDPLQQYAKLHKQLTDEKTQLEKRLSQINEVLGAAGAPAQAPAASAQVQTPVRPGARRGRKPKGSNEMSLRDAVLKALAHGPLARKDLAKAVEGVGYIFNTKNPLNSIGSVLYAKNSPVKSKGGMFYVEGHAAANGGSMHLEESPAEAPKKAKRKMSPQGRARIAAAAKARWAKIRAAK